MIQRIGRALVWERAYPGLAGAGCACAVWLLGFEVGAGQQHLVAGSITLGGVVLLIVAVSLGTLMSLSSPAMRTLRRTPYIRVVRSYLGWTLVAGPLVSCVGIYGLFFRLSGTEYAAVWAGSIAFCLGCLFRLAKLMLRVFSAPRDEDRLGARKNTR